MWRCAAICIVLFLHVIKGDLQVVTDPDGTSLRQNDLNDKESFTRSSRVAHKTAHLLAHEVARQLLAERRIAKLKEHLEQAEVTNVTDRLQHAHI